MKVQKQVSRWTKHFSKLFNRPAPEDSHAYHLQKHPSNQHWKAHQKGHQEGYREAENWKALGPDNIPVEALIAELDTPTEILFSLFEKIWEEEKLPDNWKEGLMIKFATKADLRDCKNYRGITLLSVSGKVLNRILQERKQTVINSKVRDHQAGFRQDRSCADHIETLRIIIEQSFEWDTSLHLNFIGYKKVFDTVDRETLLKLRVHYGIPIP